MTVLKTSENQQKQTENSINIRNEENVQKKPTNMYMYYRRYKLSQRTIWSNISIILYNIRSSKDKK